MSTPGARLREIVRNGVAQVMAGHSPLSARLIEEAGFDGIWASGFELSALYGLPDISLLSMRDHLDMTRAMADSVSIPIIADIDTGFGNALNAAHAVRAYERAGAAAVVIEDKSFPKMTSLAPSGRQELVRVEEFRGKIEAACDARSDQSFVIVGRTEALIAGLGQQEALDRAYAYVDAGADMILVHSKQSNAAEIEGWLAAWDGRAPVVLVPTSYPEFTLERARTSEKVGAVIHGNHTIRACVSAMQAAFASVRETGGTLEIEKRIASVGEIFRLQGMGAVKEQERQFLR